MPEWIVRIVKNWMANRLSGSLTIHFDSGIPRKIEEKKVTTAPAG